MKYDEEMVGPVLIFTLIMAVLFFISFLAARAACDRQWEGSGMKSEYRILQGCRIQLKDGRWIPADNYREI